MSTTRRDLARNLKKRLGGSIETNDHWVNELLDVIRQEVASGERVELRGFGTFEAREIKPHQTIKPTTGRKMKNPKSFTVDFRPAEGFKECLREARGGKNG